jgi:hypothetical protein
MSVDAGAVGGISRNLHASVRTLSPKQIDAIPDIQITQLTASFSGMIKGSKNIKNSVKGARARACRSSSPGGRGEGGRGRGEGGRGRGEGGGARRDWGLTQTNVGY